MGRSDSYTSPSKKIRNLKRLVSYLKQKIPSIRKKKKTLIPLSELTHAALPYTTLSANPSHPNLTSSTTFTNFPQPCSVCEKNECHYNMSHQITFSISGAITKVFSEAFKEMKPPDEPPLPAS